jgi:uncharacterized membrane protein
MQQAPIQVMVAVYPTEQGASDALHDLKEARDTGAIKIKDAAVLMRDSSNKLHMAETPDWGFGRGTVLGGVTGAVVGVIAGPIGLATLGGAAIGGLVTKLRDGGFRDERLREVSNSLEPRTSAMIAVIEHEWFDAVARRLEATGADIVTESIAADVAEQLEEDARRAQEGDEGSQGLRKAG